MKTNRNELWEIISCMHDHNINPLTREIYLGGMPASFEDEEVGVDHQMACQFIRNMTFLEEQSGEPILVHQATVGGDDAYGFAIYDKILTSPCHVTVRAYAHARSMSSITIQAADHRQMLSNCYFMIHHGSIYCNDSHKGAQSFMELCEKTAVKMLDVYAQRCKLTPKQIEAKLDKKQEWYMSAYEAKELGFVDEVID